MTPRSDRPTRETKVVERYSAPSVARSSSFKKKEHPFSFSLRLDGCKELMSGMEVAKDQELVDGTVAQESGKSMPSSQQEVLIQALRPKLQELRRKEDAIARVNGIANILVLLNQVTEIPFNNFLYCWNKS
ncbi:hypothetical protein ES288_A03G146500v1 [Gossypium darwinii]|uniref:Uncharacterized protein n=1 Tax=Gossypium darwinii TaxID=34276 RepID=A0A5D2H4H3_GOSDA|nr:hypothetical protein ES288_A03G146500v1 [Gossypium darwinii]